MSKNQILVVDDEADIRELLGMTLTRMGLDAHCAGTTSEALALLGKHSYELCLTDMRLPDGDGLAVLAYVSKHHPNMPVAVITAHGSAENAVAALKAGAFDYLAKPVSLNQLRTLGARGAARASQGLAPGRPLRRGQLRRDTRSADGVRVFRLSQRRFHRRARGP